MQAAIDNLTQAAAISFNEVVQATLRKMGTEPSQAAICRLIDEHATVYSNALHGRRGTLNRVAEWVRTWNQLGGAELELVVNGDEVGVRRIGGVFPRFRPGHGLVHRRRRSMDNGSLEPSTEAKSLEYLRTHMGIDAARAARILGVSEEQVYGLERGRYLPKEPTTWSDLMGALESSRG